MDVKRLQTLENGATLLTETMDSVETISLGIWFNHGSRQESAAENGMSHFIEHTLFKGTPTRNARAIAESFDVMGGMLDAYTAKEETCYSFKVRAKHLVPALDILVDMVRNPSFDSIELDRERQVILEEIKMEEDNPEDLAYESSLQELWADHPIGRPILGSPENVQSFTSEAVHAFHRQFYRPEHMTITAAGALDHDQLAGLLSDYFPAMDQEPHGFEGAETPVPQAFQNHRRCDHFEQVNFCLSFPALSESAVGREALYMLNTLLGGGMSSRLFQGIREERGLAYSIGSFLNLYSDCGLMTLYGGCSPENYHQVVDLCLLELRQLLRDGLSASELSRAQEQYIGGLVMSLESTQSRASALAKSMRIRGDVYNLKAAIQRIESVTVDDVMALATHLFQDQQLGLFAVGRLPDEPTHSWRLHSAVTA